MRVGIAARRAERPRAAQGFQFFVVKDPEINAFAVPGGFVFINYGTGAGDSTTSRSSRA